MKRSLVVAALVCGAGCAHGEQAAPRGATATAASPCAPLAPSTSPFELVVLGSGGPRAAGRAASSYVVFVDGAARVLVDAGPGAFVRLGELDIDLAKLDIVLLTHLHIDHSGDLPGFLKSRDLSGDDPLTFRVFGPEGRGLFPSTTNFVERLVGASGAFAYLPTFRNSLGLFVHDLPIGADFAPHDVLREDGLRISSIAVDHDDVPAVAYRIEHGGHAIVVTGDLASKNENVAALAENADLLVYDTAVVDPPGSPAKLYDLHTAPRRIGEIASHAHAGAVLLSHLPTQVEHAKGAVLASVHALFRGEASFAYDCERVELPTARRSIR